MLFDVNLLGFGCVGCNGGFIFLGSGWLSLSVIEDKWGCDIVKVM